MGVQGFQEYIEKHCPNAVVPVELQKLARGSLVGGGRQRPPQTPLRLLVDAENCLHRLYGGFYTDWVSGGQWNHMLGYLAALAKACFNGNIELLVCFNGALEKGRLHEWVKRQVNERQTAQQIVSHIQNKGTPPPKVWFLPPVCMAHCIRLALLRFHIGVSSGRCPLCFWHDAAISLAEPDPDQVIRQVLDLHDSGLAASRWPRLISWCCVSSWTKTTKDCLLVLAEKFLKPVTRPREGNQTRLTVKPHSSIKQ